MMLQTELIGLSAETQLARSEPTSARFTGLISVGSSWELETLLKLCEPGFVWQVPIYGSRMVVLALINVDSIF
ncbi:unnamed protein product [Calypogeia fissa]